MKEAKYYTGNPCKRCKNTIRYVSNRACVYCKYKDSEKVKAYNTEYYWTNRESQLERNRIHYASNPEYHRKRVLKWAKENPEMVNANCRKRTARKRNNTVEKFTKEQLSNHISKFDYCVYCFGYIECLDHATPLARGGAHSLENLVPSCKMCNSQKGTKTAQEFLWWRLGRIMCDNGN